MIERGGLGSGKRGIFAGEISPSVLDWRLQKVIWTWSRQGQELALVRSPLSLPVSLPSKPLAQPTQLQGQGGPGSLFLASPAEGFRAELRSVGVWDEISALLPEGRYRKYWASVLLTGVQVSICMGGF